MKEEIVQKFLKSGKLLTPEALEALMKGETTHDIDSFIVTKKDMAKSQPRGAGDTIRIVKNITSFQDHLTVDDFARFYKSKYDKMKNIITARLQKEFVSLNKLDNYREEVYTMGIVRGLREKDNKMVVELEDPTAAVPIVFEKELIDDIELDDVIAVRAVSAKNMMFGKQVIFPDVPLRQPKTSTGMVCFAPSLHMDEAPRQDVEKIFTWLEKQEISNIFFAGDIGDATEFEALVKRYCYNKNIFVIPGEKDTSSKYPQLPIKFSYNRIIGLSNPSVVEINGINILLTHNFSVSMLKKRYLGKPKRITEEDYLTIDEVPDIVLFNHHQDAQVTNYKSITIVNPGSLLAGTNVTVIDLATREVQQLSL